MPVLWKVTGLVQPKCAMPNDTAQLYNNVMGVSIAMIGVILYGHLKHASGQDQPDCLDMCCPGCVLQVIEPKYNEAEREETQVLKGSGNA